jgi:hypothetical protein
VLLIDDDPEDQEIFADIVFAVDPSIKCLKFFSGIQALRLLAARK